MPVIIDGSQGLTFPDTSRQYNGYFGFKNRIINGDMRIDQRNAGASVTPAGGVYSLDRWAVFLSQASKYSFQQNAGALSAANRPAGFTNYLGVTSTSAYPVLSGDFFFLSQTIEGFNVADLGWGAAGAQTVTLSFKVRSSLTGTFGGAIRNGAATRNYPFSYTISAANTWTDISITIPGDTSGTWATDNSAGLIVSFGLGAGSTFSGTAGAWAAGNIVTATGATSVVGTNGATFYITGVQLEEGVVSTNFDVRPYGTELMLCQRYFTRYSNDGSGLAGIGSGFQVSTTQSLAIVNFPVQMRSEPTAAISNLQISDRFSHDTDVTLDAIRAGYLSAEVTFTNASVGAQYRPCTLFVKNNTSGFLNLSAEL